MYKAILPAVDWYFAHERVNAQQPPVVWNLAAWGLTEEGEVVGLIGAFGRDQAKEGKTPHLVRIPPVGGAYLHRDQLTEEEICQARKR